MLAKVQAIVVGSLLVAMESAAITLVALLLEGFVTQAMIVAEFPPAMMDSAILAVAVLAKAAGVVPQEIAVALAFAQMVFVSNLLFLAWIKNLRK